MKKTTMDDLRIAILKVLQDAAKVPTKKICMVDKTLLCNLQAEYNIYFVEPEDKQLEVV